MTGDFFRIADESGWVRVGDRFRASDGSEAWLDAGGGGLPGRSHVVVSGEYGGRRHTFAVAYRDSSLEHVTRQALMLPAAIASGAFSPWLARLRQQVWGLVDGWVWGRAGSQPWWRLGRRGARMDPAARPWLAALVPEPAVAAVGRAERAMEILRAAGWRGAAEGRPRTTYRSLAAATFRGPDGIKHVVHYVLTGDARMPEAVLWRYESGRGLLADATATMDPALPGIGGDRLAEVLDVIIRETANPSFRYTVAEAQLTLATCVLAVRPWDLLGSVLRFQHHIDGFDVEPVPLPEAVSAVHAEPMDAVRWMAVGYAALEDGLRHLAAVAFARAEELGTADGSPSLWHGRIVRDIDDELAVALLERAVAAGGVTGPARHHLGLIRMFRGDYDGAAAQYNLGIRDDQGYVNCRHELGLMLANNQHLPDQAVRVLADGATAHPDDGLIRFYLGYALLLTGDRDGALTALEDAVRVDPPVLSKILADDDLKPLHDEPRWLALPALAAGHAAAKARRRRETAPPDPLAVEGRPDRGWITGFIESVRLSRLDEDVEGLTDPAARRMLREVGLPYHLGDFRLGYHRPVEYAVADWRIAGLYGVERLPDGLAGLFLIGKLAHGDVAVDGQTGEVYLVGADFAVTRLAADLETYLFSLTTPSTSDN